MDQRIIHIAFYRNSEVRQIFGPNPGPGHVGIGYHHFALPDCSNSGRNGAGVETGHFFELKIGRGVDHAPDDAPLLLTEMMAACLAVDDFKTGALNFIRFH